MKKRLLLLPLIAGFALSGCYVDLGFMKFGKAPETNQDDGNNKKDDEEQEDTTPSVVSVSITGSAPKLCLGAQMKLTAQVVVKNGASTAVTWKSSDTSVATVSSDGLVTSQAVGTVKISAISKADSTKSAEVSIEVYEGSWSASEKALMESTVGYVFPYFAMPSALEWTDEYFEEFQCLSAEGQGNYVSAIVTAMKAVSGYEYLGSGQNSAGATVHEFVYDLGERVGSLYFDVYYSQSYTSVDVYFEEPVYDTWPSEVISEALTAAEINVPVALPAMTDPDYKFSVMVDSMKLDDVEETPCVVIYAGDSGATETEYIMPEEYAQLLSATELYNITDKEGMYWCNAKDKTHTVVVYEDVYYYAIYIVVLPYQADAWIDVAVSSELLAVSETFQIEYEKGEDVGEDIVFSSSDTEVATVDATGLVTAVAPGSAVITLTAGSVTAEVSIVVLEEVPTAFKQEEIDVFKDNIHNADGVVVPFSKWFKSVAYDEENECVTVTGREVSYDTVLGYVEALENDGWVDLMEGEYEFYQGLIAISGYEMTLEQVKEMMFEEGGFMFEKEVSDGTNTWWVGANVYLLDEESYHASAGTLFVDVYDAYLYSSAEANAEAVEAIALLNEEAVLELPEINGSHYYVQYSEGDVEHEKEPSVTLSIYDCENTLAQIKDLLVAKEFVAEIIEVPADEEWEIEAYSYIEFVSADELIVGQVQEYDGDIEITFYNGQGGGGEFIECEETVTFAEEGFTNQEDVEEFEFVNGAVAIFSKGTNNSNGPKYYDNGTAIRCYGGNTITFTAPEGGVITEIEFKFSSGEGSNEITANVGSYADGVWTGEASEVVFTIGGTSGHRRIAAVHIEYSGVEGGGGGGGTVVGQDAESIIKGICNALFKTAVEGEDYDAEEDGSFTTGVSLGQGSEEYLEYAVEYVLSKISGVVTMDEFGITPYSDDQSGLSGYEAYCYNEDESVEVNVYSFLYNGVIYVNISVYEA